MEKNCDLFKKVKVDIYYIWDTKGVKYAIIELKKLYMKLYNKLTDIEDKRLILYNLICAEYENGDLESVRLHSEQLKKDMDMVNYKKDKPFLYANMLTYYIDSHSNLSYDKVLEINKFYYDLYKDYDNPKSDKYLDYLNSKFNLNLFLGNFKAVLEVIKDMLYIQNNTTEYKSLYKQMLDDIKNKDIDLYNEVQELENQSVCEIA